MLAPHRKKGKPPPRTSLETTSTLSGEMAKDEQPMVVLPSSTELFYFYAQSLDQCAKLSTGQPLFDLCDLHKKWLRIYAGLLFSHSTLVSCNSSLTTRGGSVPEWIQTTVSDTFRAQVFMKTDCCCPVQMSASQLNRDMISKKSNKHVW